MGTTEDELREQIIRMRPWHLDVEVRPGLSTAISRDGSADSVGEEHVTFISPRAEWGEFIDSIYPEGSRGVVSRLRL